MCNMPIYQADLCNQEPLQLVTNQTATSYTDAILRDTDYKLSEPDEARIIEFGVLVVSVIIILFVVLFLCYAIWTFWFCRKIKCCAWMDCRGKHGAVKKEDR